MEQRRLADDDALVTMVRAKMWSAQKQPNVLKRCLAESELPWNELLNQPVEV